jgi:hypothetical protein
MASKSTVEQCSVGEHVNTPCFLSRYVKEDFNLQPLDDLDEDTRLTIQFRTNLKPIPSICAHHKAAYTTRFKQLKQSKKCDNPFDTHLKTKRPPGAWIVNLEKCVKLDTTQHKYHIYPGQLLCKNCSQQLDLLILNTNEIELPCLPNLQSDNLQSDVTNIPLVIYSRLI